LYVTYAFEIIENMGEKMEMRKILPLCVIALILFSLTAVPVKASPARVYVSPVVTPGVSPGEYVAVDVRIEGAVDLVQWELDVKVDPAVLEVVGADDGVGTALYDKYKVPYWTAGTAFMAGTVDTVAGTITDVSQAILSWPDLYPAGKTGYNGTGKLCTLYFISKSLTAHSLIDLMDVWLYDGLYYQTGAPHRFPADIVEDGHYNQPAYTTVTIDVWAVDKYFPVTFVSNSTIQDSQNVVFSETDKSLSFNATGPAGTGGFCNVTIPLELLWLANVGDTWMVKVNGTEISGFEALDNGTHTTIGLIKYSHNALVEVIGTGAYAEFPTSLVMPLLLVITLFVAILGKTLWSQKRKGRVIATQNKAV